MWLIKINVVGLQSLERRLHLPHDPRLAEPFALPGNFRSHLGGDYNLVALAAVLKPAADDGLTLAALMPRHPGGIRVRSVDKVQPRGYEGIQYLE